MEKYNSTDATKYVSTLFVVCNTLLKLKNITSADRALIERTRRLISLGRAATSDEDMLDKSYYTIYKYHKKIIDRDVTFFLNRKYDLENDIVSTSLIEDIISTIKNIHGSLPENEKPGIISEMFDHINILLDISIKYFLYIKKKQNE